MIEGENRDKSELEANAGAVLRKRVAVIMQRRRVQNRWQSEIWEPAGVLPEQPQGAPRIIVDSGETTQWLYPSYDVFLRKSEAEGYYHNVSSAEPCVFILWRMQGAGTDPRDALAVPQFVTLSYDEASRWMDGGESVDRV